MDVVFKKQNVIDTTRMAVKHKYNKEFVPKIKSILHMLTILKK